MTFSESTQDGPTIALKDEFGRSLLCQVEQEFEIQGRHYALLLPVDTPVEIFSWCETESGEEEELVDVDEDEIDELFPTARAVLAEQELSLQRTAVTLTVAGELPEAEEEDCFTLEIDDEDGDGDGKDEEFQILATFFHQDVEYNVCTPVDPLLIFAQVTQTGEAHIIPPEEFERLRPEIESALFDAVE